MSAYATTLTRVEDYFDRSATTVWERLTSDAPVSGVRATVRAGRDKMRALMLDQVPADLTGLRILDAGCGTGAMAVELAARGADVLAIDISPALVEIAQKRMPEGLAGRIDWRSGDMTDPALGQFDHALAMDSMIYYTSNDLAQIMGRMTPRLSGKFVFTLAPRTPLLMAMFRIGKLFPRKDRSPVMIPHASKDVQRAIHDTGLAGHLADVGRVNSGFYISNAFTFESQRP
ncbi:magnesium protoporphyrin IX methyltransferase [Flavimaricola marinus]|uniref:Magnesium protoporphyrin IX methyltransferase n=1 Tax=Flavimaricola marinus TaxID=1819565 RepID=A0A238LBV2_9RHOB|nr:magnesium protoporphyrin IX methyltransferase [Flavimaricola marinus]SMY07052.1 Magnesium-protoporphyrin O-methyltransferase [Flavimaricola marinus]